MTDTTRQILNHAADLVERGWCQGSYHEVVDGRDCYCILGAIRKAICLEGDALYDHGAFTALYDHLRKIERTATATWYNDDDDRTQAEVAALLRSVASQ